MGWLSQNEGGRQLPLAKFFFFFFILFIYL